MFLTPPHSRVRLVDVARRAGVSQSTASRALVDHPGISDATKTIVSNAAQELNFVPNVAARNLRAKHSRILGLLLADLSDPVHGQIASAFEQEAAANGYRVIFVAGLQDAARERSALRIFTEEATDGVAVVSSVLAPSETRTRTRPDRLIIAQPEHRDGFRGRGAPPPGVIQTDDASGIRAAVDHLLLNGYRDIAYVEVGKLSTTAVRREAARQALKEHGIHKPLRRFLAARSTWRRPEALAAAIANALPDALICYDDLTALALMEALRKKGVETPADVGIVGFDGIPFAAISNPGLTTVSSPSAEMGKLAASSLIRAIQTGTLPPAVVLAVEFIVRESTRLQHGSQARS